MKIIAKNKKAFFDYEISKKYLAGLVLTGAEAKAVRGNMVNLKGAFISPREDGVFIENMHISPYQAANQDNYHPSRKRKLLLNKNEIAQLEKAWQEKGNSILPLAIGLEGKYIKLEIGIGQGKKKYDKRESIKKRDLDRALEKRML